MGPNFSLVYGHELGWAWWSYGHGPGRAGPVLDGPVANTDLQSNVYKADGLCNAHFGCAACTTVAISAQFPSPGINLRFEVRVHGGSRYLRPRESAAGRCLVQADMICQRGLMTIEELCAQCCKLVDRYSCLFF